MQNDVAVYTTGLTKTFGDFVAVDHIDFEIHAGEIYGFLGPNGAGKSTTIKMLTGLLLPTSGEGYVLGYDVYKESERIKENIGYMSQRFSLYEDLTVGENIDFYSSIYGLRGDRKKDRIEFILDMANLAERWEQIAGTLSGGQKQRLALGCSIIHEPRMLFLDEPTAGVDPLSRRDFWDLLYQQSALGTTIMITTHYMDEAEHCHKLTFIDEGRLIASGTPESLKTTHGSDKIIEIRPRPLMTAYELLSKQYPDSAVTVFGDTIHMFAENGVDEIEGFLTDNDVECLSIEYVTTTLEDLFVLFLKEDMSWQA